MVVYNIPQTECVHVNSRHFFCQVMNEPVDDDFDFDAHIAKLIARRFGILLFNLSFVSVV